MTDPSNVPQDRMLSTDALLGDDEQPLDTDVDANAVDSADADEQAAREGTKGEGDRAV